MDSSSSVVFLLIYGTFCIGFVTQGIEFKSAGVSPEAILGSTWYLPPKENSFLVFYSKLSVGTLALHSFLPLGLSLGHSYFSAFIDQNYDGSILRYFSDSSSNYFLAQTFLAVFILGTTAAFFYSRKDCHPLVHELKRYVNGSRTWIDVRNDIDVEYRRMDKIIVDVSPVTQILVTDNWFLYVGQWPWSIRIVHQSDLSLNIVESDHYQLSRDGTPGGSQFITIQATSRRPSSPPFTFRINSFDYQNLQSKLTSSILNEGNIKIFKSVSERFVEVFEEQVRANPMISYDSSELEACIGCMVKTADVRLHRRCGNADSEEPCVTCYCRPMWCVGCMARWFASRQSERDTETWFSSKCPCPTCRSKFCILDVSMIAPE
uniref:Transmembrane protein 129 n=1 Tax=Caligus rogercresseyi TaxID=217165 RepID=C1BR99_CALRO|nr:Transmembrane protein 129 precursor [Caligus rogercresseyi]